MISVEVPDIKVGSVVITSIMKIWFWNIDTYAWLREHTNCSIDPFLVFSGGQTPIGEFILFSFIAT